MRSDSRNASAFENCDAIGPPNLFGGISGQTGEAGPTGCTTHGDVWVQLYSNGSLKDGLNVYVTLMK